MKNRKIWLGIAVMVLVFGMAIIGCDNGTTKRYNNDAGQLAGKWQGTVPGYGTATVTISNSGWTVNVPGVYSDTGSFNRKGDSAVLFSSDDINVGTAIITSSTTIDLVLNNNSILPGTYTLTKVP